MHSETIRPFAISAGTIPFLITSITPPSSTLSPFFSFGLLQGNLPVASGQERKKKKQKEFFLGEEAA